eukprot:scaffold68537_cov23-Tisochrysis_lutea.AAC.2
MPLTCIKGRDCLAAQLAHAALSAMCGSPSCFCRQKQYLGTSVLLVYASVTASMEGWVPVDRFPTAATAFDD